MNLKNIFFGVGDRRVILLSTLCLLLIISCPAQQRDTFQINKDGNSLLWKISGNGLAKSSFIFGTFHLMCKDDIALSAQLKTALSKSNTLYLELDMDDPAMLFGAMKYMNMQDGKELKEFYTDEEFVRITTFFSETLHTPLMLFKNAKPYFLVALLYPQMLQCSSAASIEEALVKQAKEYNIEVKGLETIEQQASIFDSIPYALQAKELLKNIDSLEKYQSEFNELLTSYKSQELSRIETLVSKSEFGTNNDMDLLVNNRNRNWISQLDTLMRNESVFAAVGAGHLVGDNGLLQLLKNKGYKVEPLENNNQINGSELL